MNRTLVQELQKYLRIMRKITERVVMNRTNKDNGFTLIELMIVVVIIGILASLAIPRFMQATTKSKQSEVQLVLKQIYLGERSFRQESMTNLYHQPAGVASSAAPMAFAELLIEIMPNSRYSYTIVTAVNTFTCTATANLDDDATIDTWTVDQTGEIINTINDVNT